MSLLSMSTTCPLRLEKSCRGTDIQAAGEIFLDRSRSLESEPVRATSRESTVSVDDGRRAWHCRRKLATR
jgi:hypothetical protein